MKYFFVCNPAAGHADCTPRLRQEAQRVLPQAQILITAGPGDATRLVREYAAKYPDEECRFYACGGDGTLLEVAEGAVDCPNAQVGCVPCGTGNDYVKMFTPLEKMRDLTAQARGVVMEMNVLRCNDRLALNICNAGVDSRVVQWVIKNKRFVPFGSLAYKVALLVCFFRKLDRHFTLEVDGKVMEDDLSIIVAANGRYYGGGFYAVPEAEPDDDELDVVYIRKANHLQLLQCLPKYASGRHSQLPDALHRSFRARELILHTRKPEPVSADGELLITDTARIRMAAEKMRFIVPEGVRLLRNCGIKPTEPVKA